MSQSFEHVNVGSDTTVFFRNTPDGVEGFVVDHQALVHTLKQRVLDDRGLTEVIEVAPAQSHIMRNTLIPENSNLHEHKFAPPFSSVKAELRLAPLEAPTSEQMLVPVTVGLALFIVLGLAALYRMVAVQMDFARRQTNFVSAVTHELKTPLTAIRMHGEMLQDGLVENKQKANKSIRTITSQAERLSRLIGNVLLLSNIEKGPGQPSSKGDLLEPVKEAISAIRPHAESAGFSLHYEAPHQVPPVQRNADGLEQILFNLVDNAIKYGSQAADKRITISVEVGEHSIDLCVRDRGPGVPPNEVSRIFQPFYRLEDELTRKNQGTGLGLALVTDLARRMGAQTLAETANPGLCVTIRFPRSR